MTGQRMAPHTPQESPKVKTKCVRVGSTRLYAPMVPLAPHPCVRWWNTEEITLKLTRLCLHSLRGGSSHQKPFYPAGQMSSPARLASLPTTTPQAAWIPTNKERYSAHSTAVAQKEPRVAQTQAAGNRKDTQNLSPEEQHLSTGNPSCCTAPPQDFHRSTFSFSESRTAFSFVNKRKSGFGPCRAGQNQQNREGFPSRRRKKQICEVPLPGGYDIRPYKTLAGRKAFTRKEYAPSVRRHSRQETACRQRPGCDPPPGRQKPTAK